MAYDLISAGAGAAAGYVSGCFTPAILRKIKAFITRKENAVIADLKARLEKLEAEAKTKV